ncbi:CTLH/CRA C-terminal to lish motif domain-containing protein [Copromyces sp. CBS 386.78]|nr:CTLH/CRA C-terminal to lish motif domain-containing protein [Copromyces sp. CBS 386.78]
MTNPNPFPRRLSFITSANNGSRPVRSAGFSHLLNPSPDNGGQGNGAGSHAGAPFSSLDAGAAHSGNAPHGLDEGRGSHRMSDGSLPSFSRAFDLFTSKEPLLAGPNMAYSGVGPSASVSKNGFLTPSYLRGSGYLEKLAEQHKAKLVADRENYSSKGPSGTVFSGNTGNTESRSLTLPLKVTSGTHRGVALNLIERPPASAEFEDVVNPLPTRWNSDDKDYTVEVVGAGYEVKYTGTKLADHEAGAIRADNPMPTQCGVYYFEVMILNKKREENVISIGFETRKASLARFPGWEGESWGYHGNDGKIFQGTNAGRSYGPTYGAGDTVGCLMNFRTSQVLFTKNGDELGIAFKDPIFKDTTRNFYPAVGLKRPGDHIWVNFGQVPFQFDIDGYMKKQQKLVTDKIRTTDTAMLAPPLNDTELIQQLVLQFLQHDGYVGTARAFAEEIHMEKQALNMDADVPVEGVNIKNDEDANNRQQIRRAILEGDIDQALVYTNQFYPKVLEENGQVYFRLRCRKFIEMIRREAEMNRSLQEAGVKAKSTSQARHHPGNDTQRTYNQNPGGGEDEMMTEGEEEMMDTEEDGVEDHSLRTGNPEDETMAMSAAGVSELCHDALEYGQELRDEFKNDPSPEVTKHLNEIFALMAYPNPLEVKEVAHLLERKGRVAVAEELNSAILTSLGKSSRAALENLYAQTTVLLDDLRKDGGDGAFVSIQGVIDEIPKAQIN